MHQSIKDLLQLYENTVASQGYARREATSGTNRSQEDRMGHVRHMIDRLQLHAERDQMSEVEVGRQVGFIQGILWSENQFSLQALADQMSAMIKSPSETPTVIVDDDEGDVAFVDSIADSMPVALPAGAPIAADAQPTPVSVSMPEAPAPSAVPVKLPE